MGAELPRRWGGLVGGEGRRGVVGRVRGRVVVTWVVRRRWGPRVVLLPRVVRP